MGIYTYGRIMISFVLKEKHVITNKKESFSRKALANIVANIVANMVNIVKRCYGRITSTKSKDTTAGQLMQQM